MPETWPRSEGSPLDGSTAMLEFWNQRGGADLVGLLAQKWPRNIISWTLAYQVLMRQCCSILLLLHRTAKEMN